MLQSLFLILYLLLEKLLQAGELSEEDEAGEQEEGGRGREKQERLG